MSDKVLVPHGNVAPSGTPLHYKECGVDNVYLLSGFKIEETDYGEVVVISDVEGLHREIGRHLVRRPMGPKEFRFLRKVQGLTQAELGRRLRVDAQTIARYEKGQSSISAETETIIKIAFILALLPEPNRLAIIQGLYDEMVDPSDTRSSGARDIVLSKDQGSWQVAL